MFIYLSKKIAIPNGVRLHALSWNPDQGWIACGGDTGLLKVLKLELTMGGKDQKSKSGVAAPSNLSMNQTLDGHSDRVVCVTWNSVYRKLTTSDETGLIIVWMLHKGMWFEEMINNRNKSVVRDMKWTADGKKICIVYEDGAVIVGSVDGNRLWGKELDMHLTFVEWSPDSKLIVFVSGSKVYVYDSQGEPIKELTVCRAVTAAKGDREEGKHADSKLADEDEDDPNGRLVAGIHWYDGTEGQAEANAPTLAIAYKNGMVQILRGVDDMEPITLQTDFTTLTQCKWNSRGSVLALAGRKAGSGPKEHSIVRFYDAMGTYLRSLKVPGSGINSLSWEGGGLRVALAVDAFIFFANIRPDYAWTHFNNTLVYAFTRPERKDSTVMFWNVKTGESFTRHVAALKALKGAGENCVLVSGPDPKTRKYTVTLCDSVGSPVDVKHTTIRPLHVVMSAFHIVIADERVCYIWQYRTQLVKLTASDQARALEQAQLARRSTGRERLLDVENRDESPATPVENFSYPTEPVQDPITAVTASDKNLIIGRKSGLLQRYTLPHITLEQRNTLRCQPALLKLNCESKRLAIIDNAGMAFLFDLDESVEDSRTPGRQLEFERKDAWDLCWASDNPNMFAIMEKTRMFVFDGLEAQEPVVSSGYLAGFSDLMVTAVMLDEIMLNPDKPTQDCVVEFETKDIRETRNIIESSGLPAGYTHISENPHPRLWRFLAEHGLQVLDFSMAHKALVQLKDFPAIQFVKKVQGLGDKMKQRAEIAAYFGRYDEAEGIYRDMDRNDLAIDLRMRLGDWFKVVSLIQKGGGDDRLMMTAMTKIGEHFAERAVWDKAAQYFHQAKQFDRMAECYYRLGEFKSLAKLTKLVPQGTPLLLELARMFESVGMNDSAVECYMKAGEVRAAIDCCVLLNDWGRAVQLAEEHDFPQIEGLLAKYVRTLMDQGDKLLAVELYRKANKATEAAKLLAHIAEEVIKEDADPLRAKKLHVLAALEVERFRKAALDLNSVTGDAQSIVEATAKTLDTLMTMDQTGVDGATSSKVLDNAWRGAAAYHYFLLAQRQLYSGHLDQAMKTSIRLAEYEDILPPKDIYSLIALTSFHNNHFGICSRAFIKLETMPSPEDNPGFSEQIQNIALQIFTKNSPLDPQPLPEPYMACLDTGVPYNACTATGRLIQVEVERNCIMCRTCRHYVLERELQSSSMCPLCHSRIV